MISNPNKELILVVDDDRSVRLVLKNILADAGYRVAIAANVAECLAVAEEQSPQLILLDLDLPDGNGIDVLRRVRAMNKRLPIILITAAGDSDTAISAARFGAADYLTKPLDVQQLQNVVRSALRTTPTLSRNEPSRRQIVPIECDDELIGRSPCMQAVLKKIGRVARQSVSVMIRGESGTGKELVARAIWQHSDRSNEPFAAINCAALSNELLESELFGHEKGSFTGADHLHIGRFEAFSRGTIFLDEVGDMQPAIQAKLLRVLQERKFTRVGGEQLINTDARIISATNRDLETLCLRGLFRLDLFHRLNGFPILVPPLRDRGDDIRLLLSHFLHRNNQKLNKQIEVISPQAAKMLEEYSWPGNVRELESVLSQMMLNVEGAVIDVNAVPPYVLPRPAQADAADKATTLVNADSGASHAGGFESFVTSLLAGSSDNLYAESLDFMERYLLSSVLAETDGNQSAAARRLGITRGSLRYKLKRLGVSIDHAVKVPWHG